MNDFLVRNTGEISLEKLFELKERGIRYIKVAENIIYDEKAAEYSGYVGYARDMTSNRVDESNNLIGGLLRGMSMCRGYSEILRNLLSEVGISAIVICGGSKTMREGSDSHAWNQVYLDGKWYNCDITNDADFINSGLKLPLYLKSNNDFGKDDKNRYTRFPPKNPEIVQLADTTISDEQQEELIEEQRKNIMNERIIDEKSNEEKPRKNNIFINKLYEFLKRIKLIDGKGEIR